MIKIDSLLRFGKQERFFHRGEFKPFPLWLIAIEAKSIKVSSRDLGTLNSSVKPSSVSSDVSFVAATLNQGAIVYFSVSI